MTSTNVLANFVGDTDSFFEEDWRTRPRVHTPPGGVSSPLGLTELESVLASGLLRPPYLEAWSDGEPLRVHAFTRARTVASGAQAIGADPVKLDAVLADGATLLLRDVGQWHAPTSAVVDDLARELGLAVEAFYFITPAGRSGLALHRDDADVLVVQVSGSKGWRVHTGPTDAAWRAGPLDIDEQPVEILQATLHPGEVLYIPRGFAHCATGQEGLSAHLSLTIREIGGADLVAAARTTAFGATSSIERSLPLSDEALLAAAASLRDAAMARLSAVTAEELVAAARRARLAGMPNRRADRFLTEHAARP